MRKPEIHVRGLGFPEGPVALPDGSIAFVDLLHQKIRVYKDGKTRTLCVTQGSPNGMRLGPDGHLYVANNGGLSPRRDAPTDFVEPRITGRIQRVTLDGAVTDVATDLPGGKPSRPNDLVFAPSGQIVFTDPQNWEELRDKSADLPQRYHGGQVLMSTLDGRVTHLAKLRDFPNGLVFHPDGSLIVGLTVGHCLLRMTWHGDRVGEPQLWCDFDEQFGPDGMAFHNGLLYLTGSSGDRIAVLDLDGKVVEMFETGANTVPTNLCIQGDTLWVTFGISGELAAYRL